MTHCTRLLDVLADGEPHDHLSLYRLGMIVHSRVSELRKRGYRIDMWRDGDLYLYQLIGTGLAEGEKDRSLGTDKSSVVHIGDDAPSPGSSSYSPSVNSARCCVEPDPWSPPRAHRDAGNHASPARGGRALQSSEQLTLTEVAA